MVTKLISTTWRKKLENVVMHPKVQSVLVFLIIINAILMGLETNQYIREHYSTPLQIGDQMILGVFVVEIFGIAFGAWLCFF